MKKTKDYWLFYGFLIPVLFAVFIKSANGILCYDNVDTPGQMVLKQCAAVDKVCEFFGSKDEQLVRCGGDADSCLGYGMPICEDQWELKSERCIACCSTDQCNRCGPGIRGQYCSPEAWSSGGSDQETTSAPSTQPYDNYYDTVYDTFEPGPVDDPRYTTYRYNNREFKSTGMHTANAVATDPSADVYDNNSEYPENPPELQEPKEQIDDGNSASHIKPQQSLVVLLSSTVAAFLRRR